MAPEAIKVRELTLTTGARIDLPIKDPAMVTTPINIMLFFGVRYISCVCPSHLGNRPPLLMAKSTLDPAIKQPFSDVISPRKAANNTNFVAHA